MLRMWKRNFNVDTPGQILAHSLKFVTILKLLSMYAHGKVFILFDLRFQNKFQHTCMSHIEKRRIVN